MTNSEPPFVNVATTSGEEKKLVGYSALYQLDRRYTGSSWSGSAAGEERWDTSYDDNGNLTSATQETYNGSVWSESEEWVYEWNTRDQMTRAVKYAGGSADNALEERCSSFLRIGPAITST